MDVVLKKTLGRVNEATMRARLVKDSAPADRRDHPRIVGLYDEVLRTFDVAEPWPLYVVPMGGINAGAVGMASPVLIVSLESLQTLDDAALRVILAHEVGHLLSGHVLYKTMLRLLLSLGWAMIPTLSSLPLVLGVMVKFLEWERCSELSADRASALAMGGPADVRRVLEVVGRGREQGLEQQVSRIRLALSPARREQVKGLLDTLERVVSQHPPVETRIAAVEEWSRSAHFAAILGGDYPHRAPPTEDAVWPDALWTQARAGVEQLSGLGERASAAAGDAVLWLRARAGLDR